MQAVTSNGAANGICNQNLPNDSVYKRFLYFVSALAHNDFYIAIDNHVVYDTSYQNPTQWGAMWAQVRLAPTCLPVSCAERAHSCASSHFWLSCACSQGREQSPPMRYCNDGWEKGMALLRWAVLYLPQKSVTCLHSIDATATCAQLLKDLNADPVVKNRIMIDIMNEPDARQLTCDTGHATPCVLVLLCEPRDDAC